MAAKRRHWKQKDGRFWARISIPVALRPIFDGKTQLTEPLGGDLRVADKNHAAALARLQEKIENARSKLGSATTPAMSEPMLRALTPADNERAGWLHYTGMLQADERNRASMPTPADIDEELEKSMQISDTADFSNPSVVFNRFTDYELKLGARDFDAQRRTRRLAALRSAVTTADTRLVDDIVQQYVDEQKLLVEPRSSKWRMLAHTLTRAEIEALQRTLERDSGIFNDTPSDAIVKPPVASQEIPDPVPLQKLFDDYIATRQAIGKHRDGGANWQNVIVGLIKFLGHSDARKITKRNLLDWRDALMASGKSAKTVSDKHLAAVSAVLRWASENDHLPTNEVKTVRQQVPRKVQTREKGYTTEEAVRILKASLSHMPSFRANPANRTSEHITAARRWVPLLCAFTGARPSEMTQLRKEDVREEGGRWILRISPDAGTVKTGQYRDVPLHHQVIALGFMSFLMAAKQGPLFHRAKLQSQFIAHSQTTAGRLTEWLHSLDLVPSEVQPNYGWRHRFKTLGRDLGASDRVLDAIQGHPGRTASDAYGDVTITAKLRVIDNLSDYDVTN
jgi:integrase